MGVAPISPARGSEAAGLPLSRSDDRDAIGRGCVYSAWPPVFCAPWVIRKADYLAFLAHRFDFDADTVWNDGANAGIRTLR